MIRRAAIAAVATAAALIVTAVPARAQAQAEDLWQTSVKCATGAFTGKWAGVDDQGHPATWLEGWIQPCSPPESGDKFGVIYYSVDPVTGQPVGYVNVQRLRQYARIGIETEAVAFGFSGTVDNSMRLGGQLLAVCVAYDDGGPVACADPSQDSTTVGLPSLEVLARAPVTQVGDRAETNPNCGTCL